MEAGGHRSPVPIDRIIARELEILGSHGMQAHRYPEMLGMIRDGRLDPQKLIGKTVALADAPRELISANNFNVIGVTVIDRF
jgi:alcohol dehydrogenase